MEGAHPEQPAGHVGNGALAEHGGGVPGTFTVEESGSESAAPATFTTLETGRSPRAIDQTRPESFQIQQEEWSTRRSITIQLNDGE
jgi:hypothetical protein